MQALLDNDLLYKLTRYDLLFEFERLLGIRGFGQPHGRISTAPYALRLMKHPLPPARWPDAGQARALRDFLLKRSHGVTGTQADILSQLNIEAFDPGEVTLVAYALEHPDTEVLTGDKRALCAIATQPALALIARELSARCVHLEMVMRTPGRYSPLPRSISGGPRKGLSKLRQVQLVLRTPPGHSELVQLRSSPCQRVRGYTC